MEVDSLLKELLARRNKSIEAVQNVEKCMDEYGIPKPIMSELRILYNELPKEPEHKEAEVIWQLKNSNLHPKALHNIGQKLNYLLVYADIGQSIKSDLIGFMIIQKIREIQREIPAPKNSRKAALLPRKKDSLDKVISSHLKRLEATKSRDREVTLVTGNTVTGDVYKYEKIGEAKKQLFEPHYHQHRKHNARKLPVNVLKLPMPSQKTSTNKPQDFTIQKVSQKQGFLMPAETAFSRARNSIDSRKSATELVRDKVLEAINKYRQIGAAKKQLYSMPQYACDRKGKGVRLPVNKVKPPQRQMNLNISKIRDVDTKIGRRLVKENAKHMKMENLKRRLIPVQIPAAKDVSMFLRKKNSKSV